MTLYERTNEKNYENKNTEMQVTRQQPNEAKQNEKQNRRHYQKQVQFAIFNGL
jgi:hypothetical protein